MAKQLPGTCNKRFQTFQHKIQKIKVILQLGRQILKSGDKNLSKSANLL